MTRDQLEHAIRATCDVSGDTEIFIIGSQSILGEFPDAPALLRQSTEIDVVLKNRLEMADRVATLPLPVSRRESLIAWVRQSAAALRV